MLDSPLHITVIGTGYVGLVSGVCFAAIGHHVTCIDTNAEKVALLQRGEVPIYEPGLDTLIRDNVAAGRLHFATQLVPAMQQCDAVFIAVGTPTAADGTSADLSAVYSVARDLAPLLKKHAVVVTKSTVPVLTNKEIETTIYRTNPQAQFDICSNPEFLREGNAIDDFMQPDRVVVGVRTDKARAIMARLYAPLTDNGVPLLVTTPESAELIKYAANAFLATKVAFINEVANIAEATDADVTDVALGIGLDSRIGPKFLQAGPGYGGSCFPKDTRAFAHIAARCGAPTRIIEAVITANEQRKQDMAMRIFDIMGGDLHGKTIAVLGVTFKANTDDMREAVSLTLLPDLLGHGAILHVCDPADTVHLRAQLPSNMTWFASADEAVTGADVLVLLTEWPQFRTFDLAIAAKKMRVPCIIDLRNYFSPDTVLAAGFAYHSIGRKAQQPNSFIDQRQAVSS